MASRKLDNLGKLRAWKDGVVARLTGGLAGLAKQRQVTVIRGSGRLTSPHQLRWPSRWAPTPPTSA